MDISYVGGDEVTEQVAELTRELRRSAATKHEKDRLEKLATCDARFDVFHFQQLVADRFRNDDEDEDEFLDPGTLLLVLKRLARLCHGIAVDPQAGVLI
jgi:hypothetical protein